MSGSPLVDVPDVRNQNVADAENALRAVNLQADIKREPSDTIAKDLVISQSDRTLRAATHGNGM